MHGSSIVAPPPQILAHMEAGAFRDLCEHLRERSDQVQNIDLMTVGGFCRNCLAKWMVLEARKFSERLRAGEEFPLFFSTIEEKHDTIRALDQFGYDEAAQLVYGCMYSEWKKHHQTKASEHQLRLYKASMPIHAIHDEEILKTQSTGTNVDTVSYFQGVLNREILIRLQSGAFRSLCHHLRERSDEVQNIDLMTWLVIGARKISKEIKNSAIMSSYFCDQQQAVVKLLGSFGYDDAARAVYGCGYLEWKSRHQKKATDEQMERFNASKELHAKHDKELLENPKPEGAFSAPLTDHRSDALINTQACARIPTQQKSLLSNVCCEDIESIGPSTAQTNQNIAARPPMGRTELKLAILTVSDRAASNSYKTGDLSGPAVEQAIIREIDRINSKFKDQVITLLHVHRHIVPDEIDQIQEVLLKWSGKSQQQSSFDIIFTTGGTGFASRDVTPEATNSVLDRECHGLMSWASMELTRIQPLASLSRASAGICGSSVIINLPGNPTGAQEVAALLFPLLIHAVRDIHAT
ncbi:hypothetical protein HJC23_010580 [Cyclotella cryptica]|uniref:MoaB/Mog domain-containing protein n=1 Tax=Cyclotella cryptica TaxID=29204 RepID=A0ABD3PNW0_9STRA